MFVDLSCVGNALRVSRRFANGRGDAAGSVCQQLVADRISGNEYCEYFVAGINNADLRQWIGTIKKIPMLNWRGTGANVSI